MPRPFVRLAIVMPLAHQEGGAEQLLRLLLRESAKAAHPPLGLLVAFLAEGPMADEAVALGFPTRVIRAGRLREVSGYARTVRFLRGWIKETRPDAVLSWMAKGHLYVSPAAGGMGIPRLWYQHGIPSDGWLDRAVAALPSEGVMVCSRNAETAQQRLAPRRATRVVYPAVEASQRPISREVARHELGLTAEWSVVLLVSRLERWKGVHVAISAAAEVLARYPKTLFVHAGGRHSLDPACADGLHDLASSLGDHWRFLGHVPPEALATWYRAADVFVHSNAGPEPFGMAVVEAMAAGLPVVVSALGGPAEIVTDGVDGILVPPGDASALARAVSDLLGDPAARARLGSAALMRAAAFSADTYPDRLRDALAALVCSARAEGERPCP